MLLYNIVFIYYYILLYAGAYLGLTLFDANGSDNVLLNRFLYPAMGCTSYTAEELGAGGTMSTSSALDEIFAAFNQVQPIALVREREVVERVVRIMTF